MLTSRIIPCLDVRDGQIVKGIRFAGLRDAGDPVRRAAQYEIEGADEIVMLDVSATPDGRKTAVQTVAAIRSVLSIPLTVGGGVRCLDDAAALLDAGADRVSINTAAVNNPLLLSGLAQRFGTQCIVLAIDAARSSPHGRWHVVIRSGSQTTSLDAIEWAQQAADLGVGEILLTSFDRDGTRSGYDLALLRALCTSIRVPVIASGGAASPEHCMDALSAGADAVLAASIFHDGTHSVLQVKNALTRLGARMRPVSPVTANEGVCQ